MSPETSGEVIFRNVLFATDFSSCAEAALPFALAMAQRYKGILYLAHVTTPDMYGYAPEASARTLFEQIRAHAREQMAAFTSRQDFEGVPFLTLFGEGEVWDTLEPMIAQNEIDLVVLSTHGRRGLKKLMMGSVAEEIVRLATVPVLTVGPRSQPSSGKPFRKVLYPTDLSAHSMGARNAALSLAAQFDAAIIALHVAPAADSNLDTRKREDDLFIGRLREFMASNRPSVPAALHIHHGDASKEILRAASEYQADLIVMSVREAGSLPRASTAFGSIAHEVVSNARCTVLTMRS